MREINVDVCKVVRRSGHLWLDIIFRLPLGYKCTDIQVTPTFYSPSYIPGDTYSFEELATEVVAGIDWAISDIAIDEYWGVSTSAFGIYRVDIYAERNEDIPESEDFPDELHTELFTSDVEFVYHCLAPSLLELCGDCSPIPDSILSQYLLLWGHTAALQIKDLPTAEYMYKKMLNCGNPCKVVSVPDCGCHDRH